ncbi:MAG: oxidoreductase, partial [Actinoplanes sp.]
MTLQRKLSMALVAVAVVAAFPAPAQAGGAKLGWQLTPTGTQAQFRGLAPVSARVAWVAGSAGTILRTVDGGRSWASVGPADAAALQFRDIEAFDATHAVALTIGEGTDSRLYRTADGGRSWRVQPTAGMPAALTGEFAFAASGTCLVSADHLG